MPTGSPHSGPGGSPRASRRSSSRASSSACGFSVTTALMTGLWRSSRARQAWRTATGETSRAAISRAISAAGRSASSVATPYPLRPLAPVSLKRHHARERGLASLELPREAPDDEPLVLDLGGVDLAVQVHDHPGAAQPLERQLVDRLAGGDEMARRVEVRAHVVRGHDVLGVHAVLGFALDVLHFERRVIGPERGALVQRLREIVQLHWATSGSAALIIGSPVPRAPRRAPARGA